MDIRGEMWQSSGVAEERDFKCVRCGNCCRWRGWVQITDGDITSIARFLGMEQRDFIEQYTRLHLTRERLALNELPDGRCIFLDGENVCRIQPVKPLQCRTFPETWNFSDWREQCDGIAK